jgi:hypothetical protein
MAAAGNDLTLRFDAASGSLQILAGGRPPVS